MADRRPPGFVIDRDALMDAAEAARIAPTITAIAHAIDVPASTLSRALNGGRPGEELLARLRCKFGPDAFALMVALDCPRQAWCGPTDAGDILIPRRIVPAVRGGKGMR